MACSIKRVPSSKFQVQSSEFKVPSSKFKVESNGIARLAEPNAASAARPFLCAVNFEL
jgi:hypothetical protein